MRRDVIVTSFLQSATQERLLYTVDLTFSPPFVCFIYLDHSLWQNGSNQGVKS